MYVASHYLCILIRFSNISHVCTPKIESMMAGPPKPGDHTSKIRKGMLIMQQTVCLALWRGLYVDCFWGVFSGVFVQKDPHREKVTDC